MASVAMQGARTLIAKSVPKFTTSFDLLSKTNMFNIEVSNTDGKKIKLSMPQSEVETALEDWKKQVGEKLSERFAVRNTIRKQHQASRR